MLHSHDPHGPDDRPHDVVVAEEVTLGYGSHVAVRDATFRIPGGRITAIIGPNGSGKSTILNAIAGLNTPRSGRLTVLGTDPVSARSRLSYVLQYTTIPKGTPLTVAEAVGMGRYPAIGLLGRRRARDRQRVREAMADLDITELAHRHLSELSGGQRQRVYVALGIAQDHDVLLLDEPLTGLDLVSAKAIDRIIHGGPGRGCCVVLTTHDIEEARTADHVLLVGGGRVLDGPPAEVLTMANLQQAYGLGSLHHLDEDAVLFPTEHHHPAEGQDA
jgi:iron complex transport system ATP-binding protein